MKNQHFRTFVLVGVFCGCLLTAAHGQQRIATPEVVAGPWEFTGPSGVEGIFLSISTHAEGTGAQPIVTSQTVDIRVYYRQNGHKETWGWYSAAPSGPADAPSVFDGRHLRIRTIRNGPVLDLTFHTERHRWTGTWTRESQPRDVVLERPKPPLNVAPNPLKGVWEGVRDGSALTKAQTRLHVDQSSDGTVTVWMDRFRALIDQRHGEWLRLVSVEKGTIILDTTSAVGPRYRFQGTLAADGSTLVGSWNSGGGGTLDASESFRRFP